MALDGQRGPLRAPEADRHALPQRARGIADEARLRHREDHADGRFEIAGVSRQVVEAFSTRRAEIEAAMAERNLGNSADNPRLAERAALMTRAAKRDIDREELRDVWQQQAAGLGLNAPALVGEAAARSVEPAMHGPDSAAERTVLPEIPVAASPDAVGLDGAANDRNAASEAVAWAMAHLSEREAVFARADLFAAALAHAPGTVTIAEAEREVARLEKAGALHAVDLPGAEDSIATAKTVAEERETVASMRAGQGRGAVPMRGWQGAGASQQGTAHGRAEGRRDADPVGEGPGSRRAGLCRLRQDHHARPGQGARGKEGLPDDWARAVGLGGADPGVRGRYRERDPAAFPRAQRGRRRGQAHKQGREGDARAFAKTILVVDEGSLASTVQARDLLRIANEIRIPRVVLVGDAKQLDAVDAENPSPSSRPPG